MWIERADEIKEIVLLNRDGHILKLKDIADEMSKNRHKTFTLTIGKPIPWQTFDKTKTPAQWAQFVKDVVYKL